MKTSATFVITILLSMAGTSSAKDLRGTTVDQLPRTSQAAVGELQTLLNVNDLHFWIDRKGQTPYPAGSYPPEVGVIFADGIVWGAKVSDNDTIRVRVNGNTYGSGLKAGRVLYDGSNNVTGSENPDSSHVWRVRTDYLTVDLTADAASYFGLSVDQVTSVETQAIFDQYALDWQNWPAAEGAPYDDVNNNETYDSASDIPGEPGAAQTIWLVANDLPNADGGEVSYNSYGSPPIGIEMQLALWSYALPSVIGGPLPGAVMYRRVRLIYTGLPGTPAGSTIDTMYVTQWSDPDLGDFTDDFIGWDPDLSLGYAYNGDEFDWLYADAGYPPGAVGYKIVQNPTVGGTQVATVSSFTYFAAGSNISDPTLGSYSGTLEFFNLMEGFLPQPAYPAQEPWIDPTTGAATKFVLSGDPLTGTGWVDGIDLPPGDRRLVLSAGPFSMALGDTVETVVATTAAMGIDRLSSVAMLWRVTDLAQQNYTQGWHLLAAIPEADFVSSSATDVIVRAFTSAAITSASFTLKDAAGTTVATADLFDDGAHDDGLAGDLVFGNKVTLTPNAVPLSLNVDLSDGTQTFSYVDIMPVTTDGSLTADDLAVMSDHLHQNGQINPGDNVHLVLAATNNGQFTHLGLKAHIFFEGPFDEYAQTGQSLPDLTAGSSGSPAYDVFDPNTYSVLQVSSTATAGDTITAHIILTDDAGNLWLNKLTLLVMAPPPFTNDVILMSHPTGSGSGEFGYRIYDPGALNMGHNYELVIIDSIDESGTTGFTLRDLTDSQDLLVDHILPDDFSHNIPITEGFKITRGTATYELGLDWASEGTRWISGTDFGLSLFFGGVDLGENFFGSTIGIADAFSVELDFQDQADVDANGYAADGAVYNRHDSYAHAGIGKLPFTAWEIDTAGSRIRQLNVSFAEYESIDQGYPPVNLTWDMGWFGVATNKADGEFADLGGREYIFIHASDYNGGVDYNDDNWALDADVVWAITPGALGSRIYLASQFTLNFYIDKPVTSLDVFQFSPVFVSITDNRLPLEYALSQNYPNPFNPVTRIDYSLPQLSDVSLVVYDILGRVVIRLVDEHKEAGNHQVYWQGRDRFGRSLSSGIYIYRLKTSQYTHSRKLVLLK
ncbi:MAG: T9SS type A sorting domain-containing protein [Candidatus Marinimicrobia bacterium]|nr:T9SS type A sorting domain-containing protein [Candidatus Neomarinimicrobiota bacterium]